MADKRRVNLDQYFFRPKSIDDMLSDCVVSLDSCVLLKLIVYRELLQESQAESYDLFSALSALAGADRFVLPEHVVWETHRNLPDAARAALKSINAAKGKLNDPYSDNTFLRTLAKPETAKITTALDACAEGVTSLLEHSWTEAAIEELIRAAIWTEFEDSDLKRMDGEATKRFEARLPPGVKDKGKGDNASGDYIIWQSLLNIANEKKVDILFVTEDVVEGDWFELGSGKKNVVTARRALVEEFAGLTGGHTFAACRWRPFSEEILLSIMESSSLVQEGGGSSADWGDAMTVTSPEPTPSDGMELLDSLSGPGEDRTPPFAATGDFFIEWHVDGPAARSGQLGIRLISVVAGVHSEIAYFSVCGPSGSQRVPLPSPVERYCLHVTPSHPDLLYRLDVYMDLPPSFESVGYLP